MTPDTSLRTARPQTRSNEQDGINPAIGHENRRAHSRASSQDERLLASRQYLSVGRSISTTIITEGTVELSHIKPLW